MTQHTDPSLLGPHSPLRSWGAWAVGIGAIALILVFIHIGQPFAEPQPSVGTQVGEVAGDMARSAWRSFFNLEREVTAVEPAITPIDLYIGYAGAGLGIVAIVLAMISGIMRENWHYAVYGTGLGAASVLFFFFWWVAMLICGILLLVAIIENLGSFFSFGLWD